MANWGFATDIKTDAVEQWAEGRLIREGDQSAGGLQVGRRRSRVLAGARTSLETVYSYGEAIAVRFVRPDGTPWFLLNGDAMGPSMTRHQNEVRKIVDRTCRAHALGTKGRCIVPFSAVVAAGLNVTEMELLDTTGDIEVTKTHTTEIKGRWMLPTPDGYRPLTSSADHARAIFVEYTPPKLQSHDYTVHTLGDSLFRCTRRYTEFVRDPQGDVKRSGLGGVYYGRYVDRVSTDLYVSGVDQTAGSRRLGYFLTRLLPNAHPATTVAQAFQQLKPLVVRKAEKAGVEVLRQGDQFFIPIGAPTLSARMLEPYWARRWDGRLPNTAGEVSRHVASTGYPVRAGIVVTGAIRHIEGDHSPLYCRGERYLCVPNHQARSWGASGRVD